MVKLCKIKLFIKLSNSMYPLVNNWQIIKQTEFKFKFIKSTFNEKQKLLNKINTSKCIEDIIDDLKIIDLSKMYSELEKSIFNIPNNIIENVLYQILLFKYLEIYGKHDLCRKYIKTVYKQEIKINIEIISINFIFDLINKKKNEKIIIKISKSIIENSFCWIRIIEYYEKDKILKVIKKIKKEELFFVYIWCLNQNINGDYKEIIKEIKEIYFKEINSKELTINLIEYFLKEIMKKEYNNEIEKTINFLETFFNKNLEKTSKNIFNNEELNNIIINENKYIIDYHILINILDNLLIKKDIIKILNILEFYSKKLLNSYILDNYLLFINKLIKYLNIKIPKNISILYFISNIENYKYLFQNSNQTLFYNIYYKNILKFDDIFEKDLLKDIKSNKKNFNLNFLSIKI